MVKYKVIFDREVCIGALACLAVADKFWKESDDGKVDLIGGKLNEATGKWELIIDEEDLPVNQEGADVCPVIAIIIVKDEE